MGRNDRTLHPATAQAERIISLRNPHLVNHEHIPPSPRQKCRENVERAPLWRSGEQRAAPDESDNDSILDIRGRSPPGWTHTVGRSAP